MLTLYASLLENRPAIHRRFEEIVDDGLRELFSTFDLLLLASFLAGYLSEAGRILGREIVRADPERLAAGWVEIAERLRSEQPETVSWERLPVDFGRWTAPRAARRPPMAERSAEKLNRHAPNTAPTGA